MSRFPHASLRPSEATPRISPATARLVIVLVEKLRAKEVGGFPASPAICVAIWQGGLVKWLVNEEEAQETIKRIEKRLATIDAEGDR